MKDHGLFQAICRVNRLHTASKDYGYIVDYKDLFKSLEKSIEDYTSEAFDDYDAEDVKGLLTDRLTAARENLDTALEAIIAYCEPIFPQDEVHFIRYFCGNTEIPQDILDRQERRDAFYTFTAKLIRAYANLANEMQAAGYTEKEARDIKHKVKLYTELRDAVKHASGDYVVFKRFEPGMRQLIDMYITASPSKKVSALEDMSLVELIVERGVDALDELPEGVRKNKNAVAETIENNLRKVIIEEQATNPKYYERMSALLAEIIHARKQEASEYADYLKKIVDLSKQVHSGGRKADYPTAIDSRPKMALYDQLGNDVELSIAMDKAVKYAATDGWKGNKMKERKVLLEIEKKLPPQYDVVAIFELIKKQDEY